LYIYLYKGDEIIKIKIKYMVTHAALIDKKEHDLSKAGKGTTLERIA
jgi:hypothetical protein